MDFGQNSDQQVQFMQNILQSPAMMQQAFNGFMTQMMPQMMPQLMQMFAKQMQSNLTSMTNGASAPGQPSIPPNFPKAQEHLANLVKSTPTPPKHSQQSTTQSTSGSQKPAAKVKKPFTMSAYTCFNKTRFREMKLQQPDLSMGEISKKISLEYKELSEEQKKVYQKEADEFNANRRAETPVESSQKASQQDGAQEKEKKPLTPFMFYMQVRRAELRDPATVDASKMPPITEVTKIVSAEWKQLDEFKK